MDNTAIVKALTTAAAEAASSNEYNTDKEPGMRASRAGLPLLQLVMEDLVIPKLAPVTSNYKPDEFVHTMRIATGYLFEQAVAAHLENAYPASAGWHLYNQETFDIAGVSGHADFVLINTITKATIVIECKALKAYSVEEVKYQKLLTDNWGYLTQMVLYVEAVREQFPGYSVKGIWYVWIKQLEKHTKIVLPLTTSDRECILSEVQAKVKEYDTFKQLVADGRLEKAAQFVFEHTTYLPEKTRSGGYWKGTCALHFNRYSELLVDNTGFMVDDAEENFTRMLYAMHYGQDSSHGNYLRQLLDKHR